MAQPLEIRKQGKAIKVAAVAIDDVMVVSSGRFPRIAAIDDEEFIDARATRDPAWLVGEVAQSDLPADIFAFSQSIHEKAPKYPYYFDWDNVAAADTTDFVKWWDKLPQSTRKNCRRAERRGVVTRAVSLDEQLARGIKGIYDESPVRQGRPFWHYGKDVDTVLRENSTYIERSEFIASYHDGELIGFLKMVYVGPVARIMQILSCVAHYDKRPMNALIAKAVEVCSEKGLTHLIYSKYQYGNKTNTELMEFKSRNGFERLEFPRYYIPLTFQGRLAVTCRLHRGALGILPPGVIKNALLVRDSVNAFLASRHGSSGKGQYTNEADARNE